MAEAYTKLIELKVKDTDLGRALKKLTTSLDRIEKKLETIGGKGGKGFTQVSKGADKAAASLKRLQASSTVLAKASGYLRASILGVGAGLVASNAAVTAFDKALRRTSIPFINLKQLANETTGSLLANKAAFLASTAAVPLLAKALMVGAGAYAVFGSKIFNVKKNITGFVNNLKTAEKAVRKFVLQVKAPKGELTIFDRIQDAKGGGLVGLRKLLDQVTAAQSKLISTNLNYISSSQQVRTVEKALNAELMARKRIMDQIITGEQARTPTSTLTAAAGQAGGLEGLRNLLTEAQGIQDRMLTTNENYKVASARVRNIQKAINAELERRDRIMGKVNEKEQKSVTLGEQLRGLAANLGGKAVQAARPGRGIERRGLIAGGVGGLAGLGMASNTGVGQGLGWLGSQTMGAAGNIAGIGANIGIPGMGVAAKGITDTKVAMTGLVTAAKGVAAANVMNPAFVAALGVAWMAFGTKGFAKVIKGLWGVHKGSVSLLNQWLGIEKASEKFDKGLLGLGKALVQSERFLAGHRQEIKLNDDALKALGHTSEATRAKLIGQKVKSNVKASQKGREASGFATWDSETQTKLAAAKSLERKNKRLIQQGKEALTGERLMTKEMMKQNKERDRAVQKDKRTAKQRLKNWKKIRGQKAESLMLGAGFPLLFGGGVGATAGGVTGSVIGNAMGMGGFGTQILGSALGTMLETLVMKANALGEKLRDLNMEELNASGIKVNTQLALQIDKLRELGRLNEARVLAEIEVFKNTGALPGTHEAISKMVKALGDAWNKVSTTVGTTLAIIASPLLIALTKILDFVNVIFSVVNAVVSVFAILDKSMGELMMGSAKYRTHMWEASEAGKQARIEAERTLRAVEKEMKLRREVFMIDLQRPLENRTSGDKRKNIELDKTEAIVRADKVYQESLANLTRDKKLGGKGLDAGSDAYEKEAKAVFLAYNQALDDATKVELRAKASLELQEARSIQKLEEKLVMSGRQLEIHQKILEATKAGDTDTVARLNFESEKLSIIEKLREQVQASTIDGEKELLIKQAILDIEKLRITFSERLSASEQKIKNLYEQMGQSIENGLVNAIEGAIQGTKTLGQVASSVFSQIGRMMLQYGMNSMLSNLPGIGHIFKRAAGGPVSSGSPYIVGEKGPELFVPNSSGNIVPNHEMGGANVVVNVDASGSSAEGDEARSRELGGLIGVAIQSELARQKRPGGLLYP